MESTPPSGRMIWQRGTVVKLVRESARARTIGLRAPGWRGHRPGQHVDVRLTAPDGYQARRSYAIASAPGEGYVELTVERHPGGVVSPYLVDELRAGDALELRGPLGGHFVWHEPLGGPLLLICGGCGIVPIRSMLRHHRSTRSALPARLLYFTLGPGDLIYGDELMRVATSDEIDVNLVFTRARPPEWRGYARRIDRELLAEAGWAPDERPLAYVSGPAAFVDTATDLLTATGHDRARIRTERFAVHDGGL